MPKGVLLVGPPDALRVAADAIWLGEGDVPSESSGEGNPAPRLLHGGGGIEGNARESRGDI
jgi:hypothetical protein